MLNDCSQEIIILYVFKVWKRSTWIYNFSLTKVYAFPLLTCPQLQVFVSAVILGYKFFYAMLLSSLFQVGRIEKAGRRRKKGEQTMTSELKALHAGDYPANLSDYLMHQSK